MVRAIGIINIVIGLFTLSVSGIIGLIGCAMVYFAISGFIFGVHGGPITAAVMALFGSALLFIGFFGGRHGYAMIRSKKTNATSEPHDAI